MTNPLSQLHRFIVDHYNLDEFRTLCFDLEVTYDDLPGETLSGKARELILHLRRKDQLERLLDSLQQSHPEPFNFSTDPAALKSLYAAPSSFKEISPPAPITGIHSSITGLFIQLFFNLVLVLILTPLLKNWTQTVVPCVKPWASALSLLVVSLLLLHLTWRYLSPHIRRIVGAIEIEKVKIPLQGLFGLLEALHPHPSMLPNKLLWISFFVFSCIGVIILNLSPWPSPCCKLDEPPIIQRFSVLYVDKGTTERVMKDDVVKVETNQRLRVEAETLQQTDLSCTWSADGGTLQHAEGCATLYSAPFEEGQDTLAVLIQSPCMKRQVYAGLHIKVVQSRSLP